MTAIRNTAKSMIIILHDMINNQAGLCASLAFSIREWSDLFWKKQHGKNTQRTFDARIKIVQVKMRIQHDYLMV